MMDSKQYFMGLLGLAVMVCVLPPVVVLAEPWSEDTWRGMKCDFIDVIDTWGPCGALDAALIIQGCPLTYEHDITYTGVPDQRRVRDAWLELDFTNDLTDGQGSVLCGIIQWDFREFIKVGYDGKEWASIGEVDCSYYPPVLAIDWLNDDGVLDVTVEVWNPLGTATAWLDHSVLYGNLVAAPVPAALGVGLFGLGVAVWRLRRIS